MPRWLRVVLGILAVLILAYAIGALIAQPAPDHPWFAGIERPVVIAHQGGDGLWPSSTMFAYEHAAALHPDIVLEGDVHITADGVLVLMHDETVDRTTDGTGEIEAMTLGEIKRLDAGYDWSPDEGQTYPYRGMGLQVATLEEVFERFPDRRYVLEIKLTRGSITQPLCDLIRAHRLADRVLVGSFHDDRLAEFRATCPEIATSTARSETQRYFIMNRALATPLYSPRAHAFQVPEYSGNLHVLTASFVRGAHSRNMDVHAWTINEVEDMQRMLDLRVDGLITDYPDRALTILSKSETALQSLGNHVRLSPTP